MKTYPWIPLIQGLDVNELQFRVGPHHHSVVLTAHNQLHIVTQIPRTIPKHKETRAQYKWKNSLRVITCLDDHFIIDLKFRDSSQKRIPYLKNVYIQCRKQYSANFNIKLVQQIQYIKIHGRFIWSSKFFPGIPFDGKRLAPLLRQS